jgi:hypothetical protein
MMSNSEPNTSIGNKSQAEKALFFRDGGAARRSCICESSRLLRLSGGVALRLSVSSLNGGGTGQMRTVPRVRCARSPYLAFNARMSMVANRTLPNDFHVLTLSPIFPSACAGYLNCCRQGAALDPEPFQQEAARWLPFR